MLIIIIIAKETHREHHWVIWIGMEKGRSWEVMDVNWLFWY